MKWLWQRWLGPVGALHIAVIAVSTAHSAAAGSESRNVSRPNVLFVIADQWRASAFGYAGDPNVKTPHLDWLANRSVNFVNAIAGMPVCCPTRASLMTGQRPLTTGIFLNDAPISTNAVSIAQALRAAGYDTGYVGKWHLNGGIRTNFIPPERRLGFDYWKAHECTHDYNHSHYYSGSETQPRLWEGYDAIAQTHDVEQYLRDHATSPKPFLLFLAWGPPHNPYQNAPAKYRAMYRPNDIKLRPNVPLNQRTTWQTNLAGYYANCTALDDCLGELVETLKKNGLDKNTLLIFTSDHGDMLGSHGGYDKQQPYDEANHIPLLMHWPAGFGRKPRKLAAMINSEDMMPTILGLCGVSIPGTVEGLDFSGYIHGGANPSDGVALLSCVSPFGTWSRSQGGKEYRGIRTPRYTYARDLQGPWLLFDFEKDPCQLTNLVADPEFADLKTSLEAKLNQKLTATHDRFLPGQDYLRAWGYHVDAAGNLPH
jgi:arylsulfatase A-like enzyme